MILDLPHPQCLPRTRCWFPTVAVNHSSGGEKKAKHSWENVKKIQINGELYYVLEKAMAPHSSTLAWKIPWTEEPGRLQIMGS